MSPCTHIKNAQYYLQCKQVNALSTLLLRLAGRHVSCFILSVYNIITLARSFLSFKALYKTQLKKKHWDKITRQCQTALFLCITTITFDLYCTFYSQSHLKALHIQSRRKKKSQLERYVFHFDFKTGTKLGSLTATGKEFQTFDLQ